MFRFARKPSLGLRIEQLEQRCLMTASPVESGGIGYFAHATSIERFDIQQERWLEPVTLANTSASPSAIHVDASGIYAAFGRAVYRYNPDGASRVHLLNTTNNVIAIHADENLLIINSSSGFYSNLTSINKITNAVISTSSVYLDSLYGSSIAPSKNIIFGRTEGLSPSDLTFARYNDAGVFGETGDSPYHGAYAGASKTWVFDDERYVVDDSGNIYATSNFLHSGRLGSGITDIDFVGGTVPVVLYGKTLTSYTTGFLPSGSLELAVAGEDIFVNDKSVLVFRQAVDSDQGYSVVTVALSDLKAPQPGNTVNPVGLAFTPDNSFVASDGTVLLFSKTHQSIFRWDPETSSYSQSIRLLGSPDYVAYSANTNVLYTSYQDGLIRQINLSGAAVTEESFFQLPAAPLAMVTSGSFLIAQSESGAWSTLNSISAGGILVDSKEWQYPSSGMVWNDTNQSIYYFSMYSPSDLHTRKINANGADRNLIRGGIGIDRDTPLHGSSLIQAPVSISPDGRLAVLGSGAVFDAVTMTVKTAALTNSAIDFAWSQDNLYSIRNIANVAQVQKWTGTTFAQETIRQFSNTALRLLMVRPNVLMLISLDSSGKPVFQLLNSNLEDSTIDGLSALTPKIDWTPPAEMLSIDPLSRSILNATADVPGTMTYLPALGTRLPPGRTTLSVTFSPTDTVKYRTLTKSVSIRVLGIDFGDALKPAANTGGEYPVTLAQDGARHVLRNSVYLGTTVAAEFDGVPAATNAAGGNGSGVDEDGVRFLSTIFSLPSRSASSLAVTASGMAFVSAWIDFNGDGDWNDVNEQIAVNRSVNTGMNMIAFEVPENSKIGVTAARVRISSQTGLLPTGLANDGEVEDYMLQIRTSGEPIEINPSSTGTITISTTNEIVYSQGAFVLARYPLSVISDRIYVYNGADSDDTIEIPINVSGEMLLLGDGKAGDDRILLRANQHLDLTKQLTDHIRNIESIDIRGNGLNRLRLSPESALSVTDGLSPLEIYHDSVDQVVFDGEWEVSKRIAPNGKAYHRFYGNGVVVNLYNDRLQHNPLKASDVNLDGLITPLDALLIINKLNHRNIQNDLSNDIDFSNYVDVSGDDLITPLDVLLVINLLNLRIASGEGEFANPITSSFSQFVDWESELRRRTEVAKVVRSL